MKRLSLAVLLSVLAFAVLAEPGTWTRRPRANCVMLGWNASPDSRVIGYHIYYGGVTGNYTNRVTVALVTECTVSNLISGRTYYFAATAFVSDSLESDFSNEINYTVPTYPPPPTLQSAKGTNLFVSITGQGEPNTLYAFEKSDNLKNWETWTISEADNTGEFALLELPLENRAYFRSREYP